MDGHGIARGESTPRERVRFYLIDHRSPLGKTIDVSLLVLNLVFIGIFVADTYPNSPGTTAFLYRAEVAISFVFFFEYLLRVYAAKDRIAETTNPYTVIDLVSVLPTLVVFTLPGLGVASLSFGFLRIVRVARVLRFFRFTRDEEFFFGTVSVGTLRVMKLVLTVLTIFFVAAGLFYDFEHAVNPTVNDFGDAFYFTVVTLTTVGFGDITPVTDAGRWVTVAAIIAGIVLIPWQASKIVKEWTHKGQRSITCPQCGLAYHDRDASHCKACGHVIYQEYDSRDGN